MDGMMSWGTSKEEEGRWKKGPWTADEDNKLIEHIKLHGEGRWSSVFNISGLNRNGKSCRLRWINYLRPGLKRGDITPQEEGIIIELHALWGNRWSTIAKYLPGRTDNEIKNYWRTHFKKEKMPLDKREKNRSLQLQKQKELIVTSSKAVVKADDDLVKVSVKPPGMNEQEFAAPTPESSKEDLFRYPSMDFQYYLPPLYQNVESAWSDNDSSSTEYGPLGDLWNLEDDHPS